MPVGAVVGYAPVQVVLTEETRLAGWLAGWLADTGSLGVWLSLDYRVSRGLLSVGCKQRSYLLRSLHTADSQYQVLAIGYWLLATARCLPFLHATNCLSIEARIALLRALRLVVGVVCLLPKPLPAAHCPLLHINVSYIVNDCYSIIKMVSTKYNKLRKVTGAGPGTICLSLSRTFSSFSLYPLSLCFAYALSQ